MTTSVKQRQLRDRRDHLIDLLGLGKTYPLQDTPLYLPKKPYLVTYNNPARIGIETSQRTVLYQLHETQQLMTRPPEGGTGPNIPVEGVGNDSKIELSSYNIVEDKLFEVYALKFHQPFFIATSFAAELEQGQVSEELKQAFKEQDLTLADLVTVSPKIRPLPTLFTPDDPPADQPTSSWRLQSQQALTTSDFLIQQLESRLVVYQIQAVYLHQTAEIKVGLDKSLNAWIAGAPFLLDPVPDNHPDEAARLIDYNGVVTVEIENSQEGVYYRLIEGQLNNDGQYPAASPPNADEIISVREDEDNDLGTLGTGDPKPISLTTIPIAEDVDIRIRATKTFPETPSRENETVLLDVILPLRVRANQAPAVTVDPAPIIDFNQAPAIALDSSQSSVVYSLYHHQILDLVPDRADNHPRRGLEIIHDNEKIIYHDPKPEVIQVSVPDEPDEVQIVKPVYFHPWQDQAGYTMVGEVLPGTDAALSLPLPALEADSLVLVKAEKSHRLATFDQAESRLIPSAVRLDQAVVILVRPNPAQPLQLTAVLNGNQTNGELAITDGQPGVFYEVRPALTADPLGWPASSAYFHKLDELDQTRNKGLEQLTIGVDFIVSRAHPAGQPADPARTPPASPILDTGPIAENSTLHIQAIKAQTRVKAALAQTALIAALPEIRPEDPIVDYNKDTRLLVITSLVGDRYQPFFNGEVFKQARHGNGNDLVFKTAALTEDTVYEMRVTQPAANQIGLTRIINLPILVRPNPNLPLSLSQPMINYEQPATIQLGDSRPGVGYQLLVGGNPVGEAVNGTGELLPLQSEALNDDTTFGVRATRIEHPEVFVSLTAQVSVVVRPNPDLGLSPADAGVQPGGSTTIQLQAGQVGVSYQLLALGDSSTPVGDAVVGTGQTIALPTGPLTETTSFGVRATKLSHTAAIADLLQTVTVQVVSGGGNGGGG